VAQTGRRLQRVQARWSPGRQICATLPPSIRPAAAPYGGGRLPALSYSGWVKRELTPRWPAANVWPTQGFWPAAKAPPGQAIAAAQHFHAANPFWRLAK